MKKYFVLILALILICIITTGFIFKKESRQILGENTENISILNEIEETQQKKNSALNDKSTSTADSVDSEKNIPNEYIVQDFPFVPQAPYGVWDETFDEACEEASIILTYYYSKNNQIDAELMNSEILKLVEWQNQNWQGHFDLTVEQTAQMANQVYGLDFEIKTISSAEEIKEIISQNKIIIAPTAGRLLGNPYYRQPGPIYHMLVITGYENKDIITQDVGTKRGENYRYNEKIFFNAIHDWNNQEENINNGPKQILVFS